MLFIKINLMSLPADLLTFSIHWALLSINLSLMTTEQAQKITDEIMDLYKGYGGAEYAGEKVSQLEHMMQAAQLAEEEGYDEEVVLAAFLHDIGHISEAARGDN